MLPYLIAHYTRYWRKKYGGGKRAAAPEAGEDKLLELEELLKKL